MDLSLDLLLDLLPVALLGKVLHPQAQDLLFCQDFFLFFFVGLLPAGSLSSKTKVCSSSESAVGGSAGGPLVVYHALLAHCVQTHLIEPGCFLFFLSEDLSKL